MPSTSSHDLAYQIAALLPQTQCRQCGYEGCGPYAEALAAGAATPDRCTPGGAIVIARLDRLLGKPATAFALHEVLSPVPAPPLARIREDACIGCTKCLDACPVDAIIGAARQMHTVIDAHCTGCGLCLPPCPVDCIDLTPRTELAAEWPGAATAVAQVVTDTAADPCTQCAACVPVCPEALSPDRLLAAVLTADTDTAVALRLDRCTECNACQEVCPSRIPLTAYFVHAKRTVTAVAYTAEVAVEARRRYASQRARAQNSYQQQDTHGTQLTDLDALTSVEAEREITAVLARATASRFRT